MILAAAFLWVGGAFHWQRYATINWAAGYLAFASWTQAVLLVTLALLPPQDAVGENGTARKIGWFLARAGLVVYPLGST